MKILSIINPSYKNIPALNSNLQSSPVSVQYAYNLPCDTVSFTGRSKYKGEISEDSGWVDERDMNSDAILKHLENGSYDQALKFIQGLEEKDWEPNFCVLGTDDDDEYSLMGFVLEKMSEMNEDTEKYETLRKIAGEIASHDDFEYINEVVGEDTMFTAMASFLPEVAIDIMFSKKFQDNLENIDFDKYIDIAKE